MNTVYGGEYKKQNNSSEGTVKKYLSHKKVAGSFLGKSFSSCKAVLPTSV